MTDDRRAELDWSDPGAPRSRRFGDVYFSLEDGLAESRAVFLAGCDLPAAWAGRRAFTVAETGFGSGLNILALLELWRRERPPGGRLHVFSVEAWPMAREDAARAHAAWPELAEISAALLERWPPAVPGFHRIDLPGFDAVLDVAVGEAAGMLAQWDGRADAWFLDGFAPAANPGMWRDELLALVGAHSAPGARAATFTVAGSVRRGLAAAGFEVAKRPGHGRKRERLEAVRPGRATDSLGTGPVLVVGAGIAGAACARALRGLGGEVIVLDAEGTGSAASGNPAALVTPALDAAGGPAAELAAQALARAADLYRRDLPEAVLAEGVLRLERSPRDAARFDAVAAQPAWPDGAMTRLGPEATAARLGEPVAAGALAMADALVVEPATVLTRWLDGVRIERGAVREFTRVPDGVELRLADGRALAAPAVVLAAGWGLSGLAPDLRLRPVRGQVSWATGVAAGAPASWGGYVVPTRDGVLFGATHDRHDTDTAVRAEDHARNLELLARGCPRVAGVLAGASLHGRAAVRATTRDHLPVCGALAPGVFVLGGLGGRGFVLAPLLAEHLAARLLGRPSPLPASLAALVEPGRPGLAAAAPAA